MEITDRNILKWKVKDNKDHGHSQQIKPNNEPFTWVKRTETSIQSQLSLRLICRFVSVIVTGWSLNVAWLSPCSKWPLQTLRHSWWSKIIQKTKQNKDKKQDLDMSLFPSYSTTFLVFLQIQVFKSYQLHSNLPQNVLGS